MGFMMMLKELIVRFLVQERRELKRKPGILVVFKIDCKTGQQSKIMLRYSMKDPSPRIFTLCRRAA